MQAYNILLSVCVCVCFSQCRMTMVRPCLTSHVKSTRKMSLNTTITVDFENIFRCCSAKVGISRHSNGFPGVLCDCIWAEQKCVSIVSSEQIDFQDVTLPQWSDNWQISYGFTAQGTRYGTWVSESMEWFSTVTIMSCIHPWTRICYHLFSQYE